MNTALVVVDVQNDFCPGGSLAVPEGDRIVPLVNTLLARYPLSVLTQDWHPAGHVSFASSCGRKPYEVDTSTNPPTVYWPDHCVGGTRGADFHPDLARDRAGMILRKGQDPKMDSYSAFFQNDGITPTGLPMWVRNMGVGRILLTGLATDFCVRSTALDGRRLGLEVWVAIDAVRGVDAPAGSVARALEEMARAGCRLVRAGELPS